MALLVIAAIHTFATRKTAKPPKWMGKLESETPRTSFRLGFLLLGLFPGDIVTSVAVGAYLSNQGDPWWHMLPFLALTLLFLGLPALAVLALAAVKSCGKKAQGLPEAAGAALQAACTTVGDNANQVLSEGGAQVDQALSQAADSCKSAVKQLPAGEAQAALTNLCDAISSSN